MPLLATFIGWLASGLATFLATQMAYTTAFKVAAYVAWIAVAGVFLASVLICCSALYNMLSGMSGGGGGGWTRYLWMGLGMFIPQNAGSVMACVASVWIATSVWKVQRIGIENFSK